MKEGRAAEESTGARFKSCRGRTSSSFMVVECIILSSDGNDDDVDQNNTTVLEDVQGERSLATGTTLHVWNSCAMGHSYSKKRKGGKQEGFGDADARSLSPVETENDNRRNGEGKLDQSVGNGTRWTDFVQGREYT